MNQHPLTRMTDTKGTKNAERKSGLKKGCKSNLCFCFTWWLMVRLLKDRTHKWFELKFAFLGALGALVVNPDLLVLVRFFAPPSIPKWAIIQGKN